jgi:hypothetical protein
MDALAPWSPTECPDWDAIAGARALRPTRRSSRRLRGVRHAWTALAAAAIVGALALLADERAAQPDAPSGILTETLGLSFVPEAGIEARAEAMDPPTAATARTGRFADRARPFARLDEAGEGGLFLEAVRVAAAEGLAVARGGLPDRRATPLGPVETLAVVLEDRTGATRACTAFRLEGGPARRLGGVHCAGDDACRAEDGVFAVAALFACPEDKRPDHELDGNRGPPRASFPQPRRDRVTKAPDRSRGRAGPNS